MTTPVFGKACSCAKETDPHVIRWVKDAYITIHESLEAQGVIEIFCIINRTVDDHLTIGQGYCSKRGPWLYRLNRNSGLTQDSLIAFRNFGGPQHGHAFMDNSIFLWRFRSGEGAQEQCPDQ